MHRFSYVDLAFGGDFLARQLEEAPAIVWIAADHAGPKPGNPDVASIMFGVAHVGPQEFAVVVRQGPHVSS